MTVILLQCKAKNVWKAWELILSKAGNVTLGELAIKYVVQKTIGE